MAKSVMTNWRDRFVEQLAANPSVCDYGRKSRGCWWIVKVGDKIRPCTLSIDEYSTGWIRIKTQSHFVTHIVPQRWLKKIEDALKPASFELTFAENELDDSTLDLIYQSCSNPDFHFSSPLFRHEGGIPEYAWTKKGEERYPHLKK